MADDLFAVLSRFHREVVIPDLDSRVEFLRSENAQLHREVLSHFDQMYLRFNRLEGEYHALSAAVARLEARGSSADDFQIALQQLQAQVKELEDRLSRLESEA